MNPNRTDQYRHTLGVAVELAKTVHWSKITIQMLTDHLFISESTIRHHLGGGPIMRALIVIVQSKQLRGCPDPFEPVEGLQCVKNRNKLTSK